MSAPTFYTPTAYQQVNQTHTLLHHQPHYQIRQDANLDNKINMQQSLSNFKV
jgi:hypothetical protein